EKHQIVLLACECVQRLLTIADDIGVDAEPLQLTRDYLLINVVVFGDEHAHANEPAVVIIAGIALRLLRWRRFRQPQCQHEFTAHTGVAGEGQRAAHLLGEMPADTESESAPSKSTRGRLIALYEWVENLVAHRRRNTDAGIAHQQSQVHV